MRYFLFPLLVFFCCCHNPAPENQLIVSVEKIALRKAPGIKSVETVEVRQGDKLLDLGEVSHFESEIVFGGEALRSPWLKVQTADKQQGWMFAGAVIPPGNAADWLEQKRLDCYFGHAFTSGLNAWKASLDPVQTAGQCAESFRTAIVLRDTISYALGRRAEPEGRPDFRWMSDLLPGFVLQQVTMGGSPELFADYRFWLQKALKTSGDADEQFLETCFTVFPRDSIESIFPVWKFPLSEFESASQLGTGAHLKVLLKIDSTLAQSSLFEPELMRFKDDLLEDIQDKNTRYWQSTDLILKELDQIIARRPHCLNAKESGALSLRRTMLMNAEKNGIRVNMRTGE